MGIPKAISTPRGLEPFGESRVPKAIVPKKA
jgi:hypothetical protein